MVIREGPHKMIFVVDPTHNPTKPEQAKAQASTELLEKILDRLDSIEKKLVTGAAPVAEATGGNGAEATYVPDVKLYKARLTPEETSLPGIDQDVLEQIRKARKKNQ